jgi:hypothetical protein
MMYLHSEPGPAEQLAPTIRGGGADGADSDASNDKNNAVTHGEPSFVVLMIHSDDRLRPEGRPIALSNSRRLHPEANGRQRCRRDSLNQSVYGGSAMLAGAAAGVGEVMGESFRDNSVKR